MKNKYDPQNNLNIKYKAYKIQRIKVKHLVRRDKSWRKYGGKQ